MSENPEPRDRGEDVALEGVRLLWSVGYYDGPLDGVCMYDGRLHWFQCQPDPLGSECRVYDVFTMTDEDARAQVERHFLFEQHVGTHTCRHAGLGHGSGGVVHPQGQHAAFYGLSKRPFIPTPDHRPIGVWDPHGVTDMPHFASSPDNGGSDVGK